MSHLDTILGNQLIQEKRPDTKPDAKAEDDTEEAEEDNTPEKPVLG